MPAKDLYPSKHFDLEQLEDGIYAAIHKPGGAAYSNAGIIDLGDHTLVVDAFDSVAAAGDLRKAAETLMERTIDTLVLTHVHTDHWFGATVFDPDTTFLASEKTSQEYLEWGKALVEDFQKPDEWEAWLKDTEEQLQTEKDERVRAGLHLSIERTRHTMTEMAGYQPRYPDQTFENPRTFQGNKRLGEVRSLGAGHSGDDVVVLLHQDKIAFIGDIGFFNNQPFLGFCDLDVWRDQLKYFQDSNFEILVPGHGTIGSKRDIALQLEYFNVMEDLIGKVVDRNGSLEEAMQVTLPEPFASWLHGGMARFEVNVRYLFERLGGQLPEEE